MNAYETGASDDDRSDISFIEFAVLVAIGYSYVVLEDATKLVKRVKNAISKR